MLLKGQKSRKQTQLKFFFKNLIWLPKKNFYPFVVYPYSYFYSSKSVNYLLEEKALNCGVSWFLWYKYSRHGLFQATSFLKTGSRFLFLRDYLTVSWVSMSQIKHSSVYIYVWFLCFYICDFFNKKLNFVYVFYYNSFHLPNIVNIFIYY